MKGSPILTVFLIYLIGVCQPENIYQNGDFACNFEEDNCRWTWNTTTPNGFRLISGEEAERLLRQSPDEELSHFADADNNMKGHYLFVDMEEGAKEVHVWSTQMSMTMQQCRFHAHLRMVNMTYGDFKMVVETIHGNTSWVIEELPGDDLNTWQEVSFRMGRVTQEVRILLEVTPSKNDPSQLSLDNIRLTGCFEDKRKSKDCPKELFRCSADGNDYCLNKTKVCDIEPDCLNGEDEKQGCEKLPKFARCTFEDGWCGWVSSSTTAISWTRATGTGSFRRYSGPAFDNTYKNESGVFLYVNMSALRSTKLGSSALLESVLINPPPRYHNRPDSFYYKSCYIRFFYHQYGPHTGSLGLFLLETDPAAERLMRLWFTYGNKGDRWQRQVIQLPTNITYKYYLQFEARRGLRARGDIALDDVSMSPECFGLNVPEKEKDGYDYDTFSGFFEPTKPIEEHRDFVNKIVYLFTSCGAKGRLGPTPENCTSAYNNTNTNVTVLQDATLKGVQRWVVPRDAYYSIIANGAGGGRGYDGLGVSKGTGIVGVVELMKGQSVYILVGQAGGDACRKHLVFNTNYSCGNFKFPNTTMSPIKALKEIQKMEIIDDGGGGGGASFVFLWSKRNGRIPLIISAGGGGLAGGSSDDGSQHGKGIDADIPGVTGTESGNNSAGAGGGWTDSKGIWREVTGGAFVQGAIGGKACGSSTDVHGSGGFGGGGGGCRTGGGGGGFAGGSALTSGKNGQGGHSYVAHGLTFKQVFPGTNAGAGSVMIIPAIKGCGCEYLCVALDEFRQKVKCICPSGAELLADGVSCHYSDRFQGLLTEKFIVGLLSVLLIIVLCLYICKHGGRRTRDRHRVKVENEEPEVQLSRLRVSSTSMLTEFNPNYEFGGGTYTVRDLNEVPRENLRLVKALGQGAFGEVYQGFYRSRDDDTVEMPVAVKTLPELSTSQAEADFLMEALIMSKFTHPNIVHFIGVCFDRHPRFIVLELLAGGDLKNFLRESRPKPDRPSPLDMRDLLMCAIDIARGCAYMEEHRFIHRDIAARNCLLTTKGPGRMAKIADFGMARDIYRSDYYRKGGKAMLPIKWMPPEAFQDGMFTIKTDVWSFGVLLWEVMSLGYMPYTGCGNREVMRLVVSGGRLGRPTNCPPPLYSIMVKCWASKPDARPSFQLILERLGYCLQDPDVMNTPLPLYNLLPPPEREPMRRRRPPPDDDDDDDDDSDDGSGYLVPKTVIIEPPLGDISSIKGSYSWEPNFTMPESQSTQPLLEQDIAGPSCEPGPSGIKTSHRRSLASLDAASLIAMSYGSVKGSPKKQVSEGSSPESPSSKHLINDSEASC